MFVKHQPYRKISRCEPNSTHSEWAGPFLARGQTIVNDTKTESDFPPYVGHYFMVRVDIFSARRRKYHALEVTHLFFFFSVQ